MHLQIAAPANVLSVPSSALIFDAKGLSIATVNADNHGVAQAGDDRAGSGRGGRAGPPASLRTTGRYEIRPMELVTGDLVRLAVAASSTVASQSEE